VPVHPGRSRTAPVPAPAIVARMGTERLVRVGQIVNDYSNFVTMLAVDAAHVGGWRGRLTRRS
jgi:hypothetical protein